MELDFEMEDQSCGLKSPHLELPTDVLRQVFERALLPPFLLVPDGFYTPCSAWNVNMRMKKSIISVCKTWYYEGLPFLYEDLAITSAEHMETLYYMFCDSESVGALVKRIILACYVPEQRARSLSAHLYSIFDMCPNISVFWDAGRCHPPPRFATFLPMKMHHLSHLNLTGLLSTEIKRELLRMAADTLISLAIWEFPSNTDSQNDELIIFPRLQILDNPTFISSNALASGEFPSLHTLTTFAQDSWANFDELNPFGQQLRYLAITVNPEVISYRPEIMSRILSLCPNATHLVLAAKDVMAADPPLSHPYAEYVDLWLPLFPGGRVTGDTNLGNLGCWRECRSLLSVPGLFPALKHMRAICTSLRDLVDLPRIFPPTGVPLGGGCSFHYGDYTLHVKSTTIYRLWPALVPDEATLDDENTTPEDLFTAEEDDPTWVPPPGMDVDTRPFYSSSESGSGWEWDRDSEESDHERLPCKSNQYTDFSHRDAWIEREPDL